jgi:hypothetical protein
VNEGTCTDGVNDFTCDCPDGYDGKTCSNNPDECATNPCVNEGTCTDGVNDFTCDCPEGYDGKTCSNDIDECAPEPCQNGGSCSDEVNGYSCDCEPGYEGTNCEIDIDECAASPCENGGVCVDGVNAYTCDCQEDYFGELCEVLGACGTGNENSVAQVDCPPGTQVSAVAFASYGTPEGSCGAFTQSSCHSEASTEQVEQLCVGKASCVVPANDGVFGDPCEGSEKRLYVQVVCSPP